MNIFADINSGSYTLFHKRPFDPVYLNTIPDSGETIAQGGSINIFSAKGEVEPATFSVRSQIDLGQVTINISDLTNSTGRISKSNIDLSNINIWEQCGPTSNWSASWFNDCKSLATSSPSSTVQKVMVPELIVKDNEQKYASEPEGWQSGVGYQPLKINDQFRAVINKNSTHTFYLSIKTPKEAVAGIYTASVNVQPQFGEAKQFDLKLEVLPFELPEPSKDVGVHLTYRLADEGESGRGMISREKYGQYLDVIRQSGVTNVVFHFAEYDPVNPDKSKKKLEWLADEIKRRKFRATFIWFSGPELPDDIIKRNTEIIKSRNFDVYTYGVDEPNDQAKMASQVSFSKKVHQLGGLVTTSMKKECADYLTSHFDRLDLPIYRIGGYGADGNCPGGELIQNYVALLQNNLTQKQYKKEYYYYQIWPEQISRSIDQYYWGNYSYIRSMTGFFLYKSGLDGVMPYGLDAIFNREKEYSDYDGTAKELRNIYQTDKGWLKTLQFETFREGIDDLRYAAKFDQVIAELNLLDASQARSLKFQVDNKLSGYRFSGSTGRDVPLYSDQQQQANRRFVADKIAEAERIIMAGSKEYIFKSGFTSFGSAITFSPMRLTSSGLTVYKFSPSQNQWILFSSSNNYPIQENESYLVYNPGAFKTVFLPSRSSSNKNHRLSKGWNHVYSPSRKNIDNLNIELGGVTRTLSRWVEGGRISEYVFVVEDQATNDPCKYYSLFASGNNNVVCDSENSSRSFVKSQTIEPGKSFWVLVN